jgi:hypothetical protein
MLELNPGILRCEPPIHTVGSLIALCFPGRNFGFEPRHIWDTSVETLRFS